MYRLMQPSDKAAVLALWQRERGESEEFAANAVERFAGQQNVYVAEENDAIAAVALAVPVTLLFLGPLGTVLSGWLTDGVMWVSDTFGAWAVGLYAMINPVCVMFGLDKAITPPILTSIAANGYETLLDNPSP